MEPTTTATLSRVLKPIHIWAIGVGLVISGEYFGWTYGWQTAGTVGFLIATLLVTVLYITFIFSYTELTTMIPKAGGPFAYAEKALGHVGGLIAGYTTLVEFLFAPPAIALALGSYAHFLSPALPVTGTAIACYFVFTLINFLGVKESAIFTLFVTLLAVGELMIFLGIVTPHFSANHFTANAFPLSAAGIFASIPFAIWFYLAIEGMAMVAEEVKDPKKNIPKGYLSAIATLVLLALAVMVFTAGVGDWRKLSNIDSPLPEAIIMVLGKQSGWAKAFASLGLFGLIASFHSIILGYSREIFALAREGFLPKKLAAVHPKFHTPHWALVVGGVVGIVAILTGTTGQVITLSAIGALGLYIVSMVSLLVLRKKEPGAERPFATPFYPWFPIIALIISLVCLAAVVYFNPRQAALFFGCLAVFFLVYLAVKKQQKA